MHHFGFSERAAMKDIRFFAFKLFIVTIWLFHQALAIGEIHQVMESLNGVPSGWKRGERPSPYITINLRLALNQSNVEFHQAVIDISTPGHPKYGQHMTREEMREMLRPDTDTMENVITWLMSEDVAPNVVVVEGSWIKFQVPLAQAERMLKAQYFYYHDVANQNTLIRTLIYSVPEAVHSNIVLIQPTTRFGHINQHSAPGPDKPIIASPEDLTAECGFVVRPECLRDLYDVKNTSASPDPRNRLGISGFLEQFARHSDLYDFMNGLSPKESDANFSVVRINGGLNDEDSPSGSTEASLDIQYSISLAYKTLATFYATGGRGPLVPDTEQPNASQSFNEPYLEQLHHLINLHNEELPAVLTTSYGEAEQTVPVSYATAICDLYSQLGARGVSVIFSSGDSGVGSSCQRNDGSYQTRFLPGFPASCPFVTSVGGTYSHRPERGASFSGGGFSEVFHRPAYQDQVVQGYIGQLGDQWNGLYNPQGRGIPDVSAQASGYLIRDHGMYMRISGTRLVSFSAIHLYLWHELTQLSKSASAPVFAGIVSQLNAVRLAQGKPRMGFINPWLYSTGLSGFTDIVDGGSRGCYGGTHGVSVPFASWNATIGWDPVTGLGTPLFSKLAQLALFETGS
jgi:tripeptidyl-peptidase-1